MDETPDLSPRISRKLSPLTDELTAGQRLKFYCMFHWRGIVLFLTPLLCTPFLFFEPVKAMRCAYILCVMATYWVTEAMPIYITSLIPIVAMPIMQIMSSDDICKQYMKDVVLFFIVSMCVALSVEYSNLHTRVALGVIKLVGLSPKRLHLGLMCVTFFVSFWVSNSAAAAMMCPIVKAILMQLDEQRLIKFYRDKDKRNEDEDIPRPSNVTIGYFLGIAYSASIGGCMTLVGTGTNLAVKGLYDERFPDSDDLDFNSFFFFNAIPVLFIFILSVIWLQILYLGLFRPNSSSAQEIKIGIEGRIAALEVVKTKRAELGKIRLQESFVTFYFLLMIALLFLMRPGFFTGYVDLLNEKKINSSAPTILVASLLFMTPMSLMFLRYFICQKPPNDKPTASLMTWSYIQENMPWGIALLLGGGFALSKGITTSKLAVIIGQNLVGLTKLPNPLIQFLCIMAGLVFTAFSANVAMVNILLPILFEVAVIAKMHPLYLILPAGMACSLAFHLPVSTPPNAIVAGLVNIRTKDLAIAGIGPTIFSLIIYFGCSQIFGPLVFKGFQEFPSWANKTL